jgi:hypothetical protein
MRFRGSQTGSQRRQTSNDTGRCLATISPTNSHFRRHQATSGDSWVAPLQARGHGFEPCCAHLVKHNTALRAGVCRGAKRGAMSQAWDAPDARRAC